MRRTALLFVFMILFFSGCAESASNIKLGILMPLTAMEYGDGAILFNSVKLAQQRINSEGGIMGKKLDIVVYDDGASPVRAVEFARKLVIEDKVSAVLGCSFNTPSKACAPLFQDFGIPFVTAFASDPYITQAGNYCFSIGPQWTVEGVAAGEVAVDSLNASRVAILAVDDGYGDAITAGFDRYIESRGVEVVFRERFPVTETFFRDYLSRIDYLHPDILFVAGYYHHASTIVIQSAEINLTAKILGSDGFDSPKFLQATTGLAEGVVLMTSLNRESPEPSVRNYIRSYIDAYSSTPDALGALCYDGVRLIADAIARSGSAEPRRIRDSIEATRDFPGITGNVFFFTENGDAVKPVQVQMVKYGSFAYFDRIDDMNIIDPRLR